MKEQEVDRMRSQWYEVDILQRQHQVLGWGPVGGGETHLQIHLQTFHVLQLFHSYFVEPFHGQCPQEKEDSNQD